MTDEILEGNETQELDQGTIQADTEADISGTPDDSGITDDEGSDLQADADLEPEKKGGVQKKIDKLTKQRREAEAQAAYYKGLADASLQAQQVQQEPVEPVQTADRYDYESDEAFFRAQAKQVLAEERALLAEQERTNSFNNQMAKGREKYEDFDSIANSGIIRTKEVLSAVQATGDDMPDIIVELSKNPNTAAALHNLQPVQLGMEIGKIQARLGTKKPPPTKKKTNAPEPLTGKLNTGGSVVTPDLTKMSIKEQHAKWDADRRAAAGRK